MTCPIRPKGGAAGAEEHDFRVRRPHFAQDRPFNLSSRCANVPTCTPQSAAVESLLLRGRWAGQEARANDQGRERVGKRAQGAVSSCILVNLALLCCPATSASAELAAARPQAAISVLAKASRIGRSASHPAPRGAAQVPAPFACAGSIARTASSRVHLSCFVWSLGQHAWGRDGRSRVTGRCVQRWVAGSGAASPRPGLGRLAPAGCGAEPREENLSNSSFKTTIS